MSNETLLSFDAVSFEYDPKKPILDAVDFSVRRDTKITIMGQNGAGKSTILKLISGELKPKSGAVNLMPKLSIATAHQVVKPEDRELTVREFFQKNFKEKNMTLIAKSMRFWKWCT